VQSNKINVVGLGPGNIKYLSTAGIDCIKEAEIVVGSTRQLSDLKAIISEKQEIYILGKLAELIAYLKENIEKKITIIVSGDTGYYSLVPYLSKNLSKDILNIIPIKNIDLSKGFNFEDFTIVVLDEIQRISKGQLDYIIKNTKGYVKKCIFSIDPIQCLRKSEFSNNIEEYIKNRVSVIENQLTDTIRTSEEILTFVKSILHNKKDFKKILYKNISLKYFTSLNFVTCDLKILKDKKVWKIINNTSSRHKREFDYEIPGESNSHKIIGQEFDNVVVVIDDSFYYDDKNKLSVKKGKESYYDKFGMLYQNITRARKKLNVVIVNNQEVLSRCLEVLNSKD